MSVATKTAIKFEMDMAEDMTDMGKDGIRSFGLEAILRPTNAELRNSHC